MSRNLRVLVLGLALSLALAPTIFGQSHATTGVIEGTVVDESGAVLPGVTVTLNNTATGFERVLNTDSRGRFRGLLLPLGPYRVTASLEGFGTMVRDGIDVGLGATVNLQLTLKIADVGEEIVVTGEAPTIESTRTESQVRIDQRTIEGLPNNGRNFMEFTKLTPGATIVQGPDGEELSINGQKGINNNVSVDGADFNNPFFGEQRGGQRPPFTFNIDAVQEVLVVTEGAPAEYGRSSGGFINVVTKSGTNDVKGSVHAFYKDDGLAEKPINRDGSRPAFAFDQTQLGFTFGGPAVRDKLFYFFAYDFQEGDETKQTDPTRIDLRLVNFFASLGATDENGPITRTNDADVALAKLDWHASQSNLVTLRASYTFSEQANGTFDVDQWGTSANGGQQDYSHSFTPTVISALSDSLLNEFRGQYAKEFRPRPYDGPTVPGTDRPFPDTAILETGNRFGMPFFLPVIYDDDRVQVNDNLSILKGNHSLKVGVEYNEVGSSQTFIGFANGRYVFLDVDGFIAHATDPTSSPGPVLLFLQFAGVGGLTPEQAGTQTLVQKETALFLQDTWQPTGNITFDFGVRWEMIDQPPPSTPPSEVFYADFIGTTVTTAAGPQRFPSDGVIPDDNVIEPRLALAWSPKGKTNSVVRATAGLFAARTPALSWASVRSTNGSVGQTLYRDSFGCCGDPPAWPNLIPASAVGSPFFPDVFVPDENFELPKTYAFSLSWEKEIKPDLALLLKANYSKTDHITRWTNRNDPLLGSPWSSGLGADGSNGIGALTTVESSARSRYQGFTVGLTKRYSDNFQFQAFYTYSKDETDDDNERDPFSLRYANITNLGPEYGLSDRNQDNRFNAWLNWNAPWGIDVNLRLSYRDNQPQDVGPDGQPVGGPTDRCIGGCTFGGAVFQRNQGEKDNEFKTLDLRLAKNFDLGGVTVQPIIDVFNLTDEANFLIPETTSLAFNFDGTVRSGAGEPREIQLGVRVVW